MEEVPSGFQALNKTALYMTISEAMQQENTMLHDSIDKLVANPYSVGLAQTSPVVPLGLVIGTYAALPYIHLQLEARRRLYPDVRTLVHDDGSKQGAAIEALAHEYGAEFFTHPVRHLHHLGDLSIYPVALAWAERRNLRFLLKVSRRWIWQVDWRADLLKLLESTEAPTASNFTESYAFGFRTECVAFDVRRWNCEAFLEDCQARIEAREHVFVENYIHIWAQRFSDTGTERWHAWQKGNPVPEERRGYAPWTLMGTCRQSKYPTRLWHDSEQPVEYGRLAQEWGLPYSEEDFVDPNMGTGPGKAPPFCVNTT